MSVSEILKSEVRSTLAKMKGNKVVELVIESISSLDYFGSERIREINKLNIRQW